MLYIVMYNILLLSHRWHDFPNSFNGQHIGLGYVNECELFVLAKHYAKDLPMTLWQVMY